MPRYLIEVEHEPTKAACGSAVQAFMETGSHFVTNADWGCSDSEHKAWFVVEIDSKEAALMLLPPLFRRQAKVIALQKLSSQDIREVRDQHPD
jgi:hypothetical protein